MASVVSTLFVSLDGVAEIDPDWHFPYFDEHMGAAVDEDYEGADVLLLGRTTYESFAGAWPQREAEGGEDAPFAARLGDTRKLVATHGDQDLGWRNVERVEGDLVEAVRALRADDGVHKVLVPGSLSVVRQLLAGGVLDELRLLVHPVLAQKGEKLFTDEGPVVPLTLLRSDAYPTGVVRLVYAAADRAPAPAGYEDVTAHVPGASGA
ncbi:dihydrofolate reductase family protein [Cellulomonas sp.]|uniref:dihydrofolate reductase family protein n=1 Tax=Cellulomonas sp. TaxID=40001 RepID=UPI0028118838|nr:dihydrofolate reductase family protein [Cellulomonas sp.]